MRLLAFLICFATSLHAQDLEVDVELVLAVDVSRSMEPWELEIQRRGYGEALKSDEVWAAIERGFLQTIALTYVEWAGMGSERVIIPWTLVDSREDLKKISDRLTAHFDPGLRRTSISSAIGYGVDSLQTNEFAGLRRVIDVSGDGPNNHGWPVTEARDRAIGLGITINGLPLMTYDPNGPFAAWGIPDLDAYYEACVIGGPSAFSLPVTDWDNFSEAVRRKLVLEISGLPARIWRANNPATYNCRIGEQIWERNMDRMTLP